MTDYDDDAQARSLLGNGRAPDQQDSSGSDRPDCARAPADGERLDGAGTRRRSGLPRSSRSRITNRNKLLPSVRGDSIWARLMRDVMDGMIAHLGGDVTEPQRMTCRRIAVLETEMIFQEDRMGQMRAAGREPDDRLLDLYSRLSNTQRRHIEALGWTRVPRDVTPDLETYLAAKPD